MGKDVIGLAVYTVVVLSISFSMVLEQFQNGCVNAKNMGCINLWEPNIFWFVGIVVLPATVYFWFRYFKSR